MNEQPINGQHGQAELLDELTPEQMLHVANAGFTELFMGGVRKQNPRGGWFWFNTATADRRDMPLDVTRSSATLLGVLDKHCHANGLVWTTERTRQGYGCRIGRFPDPGAAAAELVGAAMSGYFGLSVAVALLQSVGFDFKAMKAVLYDDVPRIQLPN